ncbi:hypothetical protein MAPG_02270 [Magnaporthiopsis poae ATCC 64411]|uniref:Protein kinase domain-containing protein n=1 Tax=Magnaporthiopsis poae (strain ATCC 64411 / 73-15) TaxID=644358 RepID=A0A0C4DQX2_MAGP6|nr:hypothetical protein MAPG_02270 [Magnaporthiopsis poae ATCC 64411]
MASRDIMPSQGMFVVFGFGPDALGLLTVRQSLGSGQANFAVLTKSTLTAREIVIRTAQVPDKDVGIRQEAQMMKRLQGNNQEPPSDWPLAWMWGSENDPRGANSLSFWRYYALGDLNKLIAACRASKIAIPSAFGAEYLVTMFRALDILLLGPNAPGIDHRDIVATNIFMERATPDSAHGQELTMLPRLVLGDFGEAKCVQKPQDLDKAARTNGIKILGIWKHMLELASQSKLSATERECWQHINYDVDALLGELGDKGSPCPGPLLRGALATFTAHQAATPKTKESLSGFLGLVRSLERPAEPAKGYGTRYAAMEAAYNTRLPPRSLATGKVRSNGSPISDTVEDLVDEND